MPQYLFSNPENENDIVEIIMSIHDNHEYIKDGIKWNRVWMNPQTNVNSTSKLDPFNSRAFVELTKQKRGNVGNLEDLAREKSMEREKKLGFDPIKNDTYKKYSDLRGGKQHPQKRKEQLKKLTENPIELKLK